MTLSDLISAERVREIATDVAVLPSSILAVRDGIAIAAPEIARNVLEIAAKECELNLHNGDGHSFVLLNRVVEACLIRLRQLAKERTDA